MNLDLVILSRLAATAVQAGADVIDGTLRYPFAQG